MHAVTWWGLAHRLEKSKIEEGRQVASSHGVAISRSRVHPSTQQRLKEVHVQRLCIAHLFIL